MSIKEINILARKPKEEYLQCGSQCEKCKENCWVNVAGDFKVWSVIQHYCKATKENSDIIDKTFNKEDGYSKEKFIKNFNITDKEDIEILLGSWEC